MGLDRCWIIECSCWSESTCNDLSSYSRYFVTAPILGSYNEAEKHSLRERAVVSYFIQSQKDLALYIIPGLVMVFLWHTLLQTTYATSCPTALIYTVSMSAVWKGPLHCHLVPRTTVTGLSVSLYPKQLMIQCRMKPWSHFSSWQLDLFTHHRIFISHYNSSLAQ